MKRKNFTLKKEVSRLGTNPPLQELMERYPDEWGKVGSELVSLI